METVIELPENLNKVCRTCLKVNTNEEHENALFKDDKSTQLCVILSTLTNTEVLADNKLPQRICNNCCEQIRLFHAFKSQWEKIEVSLKQLFLNNVEQLEIEMYNEMSFFGYSCDVCFENFKCLYDLRKHLIEHNKNKTLTERYHIERNDNIDVNDCKFSEETELIMERKNNLKMKKTEANKSDGDDDNDDFILQEQHKRYFTCDLCGNQFSNNLIFTLHFLKHATIITGGLEEFREHYIFCNFCGLVCENNDLLDNHLLKNHVDESDFKLEIPTTQVFANLEKNAFDCPLCDETFDAQEILHKHSLVHLIKKYKCPICKVFYVSQLSINEHMKMHPSYKHVCQFCDKRLGSRNALNSHKQLMHNGTPTFVCDICKKSFKTKVGLNYHKKRHNSKVEKNFVCMYCGYCTNSTGNLDVHNRVHTLERPYKCIYSNCTKTFKTSSHLAEHSRRHLQIRRFKCDVCSSMFSHTNSLKKHMMQHTGEKPYQCNFCESRFSRKDHLKVHLRKHERIS